MLIYKDLLEAHKDGWLLVPCAFPTTHSYYMRNGVQRRADDLIMGWERSMVLERYIWCVPEPGGGYYTYEYLENGHFVPLATRGDGLKRESILASIAAIERSGTYVHFRFEPLPENAVVIGDDRVQANNR